MILSLMGGKEFRKKKKSILHSGCIIMCGKGDSLFSCSVLHGREMCFEGLFELRF